MPHENRSSADVSATLVQIYHRLLDTYGKQNWWPADSVFEVVVGAVLTQNTAWGNVEKAIDNLRSGKVLDAELIVALSDKKLAQLIKPSGYFNIKAQRLKNVCCWFMDNVSNGNIDTIGTVQLRQSLLQVNGVGPETADDILLYAFSRAVFVIDSYTRRIFSRLGLVDAEHGYEELRSFFERHLDADVAVFNEYHALIVLHAKERCLKKNPPCEGCCLSVLCSKVM